MANFQCKKLDPLVVGDIGDYCVECLQSTAFGSGTTIAKFDYQGNVGIGTSGVPAQRLVVEGGHATVIRSRPSNNPTNKPNPVKKLCTKNPNEYCFS